MKCEPGPLWADLTWSLPNRGKWRPRKAQATANACGADCRLCRCSSGGRASRPQHKGPGPHGSAGLSTPGPASVCIPGSSWTLTPA